MQFRSDMTVELIDSMGGDDSVVRSARVSSGSASVSSEKDQGLINYLMRDRHGSPFEHAVFTFRIEAPIFVFREFMRHRMASYNEESGRYKELEPVFYVPGPERKLKQVGKPGAYTFEEGEYDQKVMVAPATMRIYDEAYSTYKKMLDKGIAREVARDVLPLATQAFNTCRALTRPSPVVCLSSASKWPDPSPPSSQPFSASTSST